MRIVYKKPWFWFLVKLIHPQVEWGKVVLTFGRTTYASHMLSAGQKAHEAVHVRQQGKHPFIFFFKSWLRPKLYIEAELEAYQAQLQLEPHKLESFARVLASPVYGSFISYDQALSELQK